MKKSYFKIEEETKYRIFIENKLKGQKHHSRFLEEEKYNPIILFYIFFDEFRVGTGMMGGGRKSTNFVGEWRRSATERNN